MPRHKANDTTPGNEGVRLDKWLWAARFYKTRSIAAAAVDAGHVRVGGVRCKPARYVRAGDLIRLQRDALDTEVVVRALSTLRGPAATAQTLYSETEESERRRAETEALRKLDATHESSAGRPTKRDRRTLQRWRESNH